MRIVTYQITDLDYCPQCHGIFFDKGEFGWIARDERKMDKRDIADVTEVLFYALGGTIEW
jgi:Zn-finger nucleic acid-binding protein